MPERVQPIILPGERVRDGRAQNRVQIGQRHFRQRLEHGEVEDAEDCVREQAVADVEKRLGRERGPAAEDQVERDGQKQNVFKVVSENFA